MKNSSIPQKIKYALGFAIFAAAVTAQAGGVAEAYSVGGLAGLKLGKTWAEFGSEKGIKAGNCKAVQLNGPRGAMADQTCTFTFAPGRQLAGKPLASEGSALLLGGKVVAVDVSVPMRARDEKEAAEFFDKVATWWGAQPVGEGREVMFLSSSIQELRANPQRRETTFGIYATPVRGQPSIELVLSSLDILRLFSEMSQR